MKISVITVCYNAVSTIESAILSLIAQDYENVEYLVIDGGSTDGTQQVIEKYLSSISFYLSEPDFGLYDAVNKGIEHSTGDLVGLLHADDRFASSDILKTIAQTIQFAKVEAVYGNLVFFNDKDKVTRYWKSSVYNRFLFEIGWMPPHPTLYMRKELYTKYGNYSLRFGTAADYELILRFFYRHKIKSAYIDRIFIKMSVGGLSNKSFSNRITANINDFKAMRKHRLYAPFIAIFLKPLQKIGQYL